MFETSYFNFPGTRGWVSCFWNYKVASRPHRSFTGGNLVINRWKRWPGVKKHVVVPAEYQHCFWTWETRRSSLSSPFHPRAKTYPCFITTTQTFSCGCFHNTCLQVLELRLLHLSFSCCLSSSFSSFLRICVYIHLYMCSCRSVLVCVHVNVRRSLKNRF